jgi:hypothetical protein
MIVALHVGCQELHTSPVWIWSEMVLQKETEGSAAADAAQPLPPPPRPDSRLRVELQRRAPPVHAWATLLLYKYERTLRRADIRFLERSFQGPMLNFNWWVNRNDPAGRNVHAFEGAVNGGAETRVASSIGFLNFAFTENGICFFPQSDSDPNATVYSSRSRHQPPNRSSPSTAPSRPAWRSPLTTAFSSTRKSTWWAAI